MSRLFAADRTIGVLCTLFGIAVFFLGRTIPNPGLDPLGKFIAEQDALVKGIATKAKLLKVKQK